MQIQFRFFFGKISSAAIIFMNEKKKQKIRVVQILISV